MAGEKAQAPSAAGGDSRVMRVFVSSTFRDMAAERDELAKRTFPALRKLCESRGVTWGEVDLRWGITDEQKAEGKVLPICLAEIRGCRPYFIGLLGERYGWVPDAVDPRLVEREPWLADGSGRSVTELEILCGAINDPALAEHAFFYLRDPSYVEGRSPEQFCEVPTPEETAACGLIEAERRAAERKVQLAALKRRIRASGLPVRENYPDARTLGVAVLADLTAVIEQLYPPGSEPDPLAREAAAHEAFARSRQGVYVGGAEYLSRLDAHAAGDGPPIVVIGESGSGKSALLANWALRYESAHPDVPVLFHFTGASSASTDWAAMVRRLIAELKNRFRLPGEIPNSADELRTTFANTLHLVAARGRVVLIVDALDQLEDREGALDLAWLPAAIPANVRVVLSTLPGRSQAETARRGWHNLTIVPLEPAEIERLIVDYLASYSRALGPALRERIASSPQCRNPLYLRALLDELRVWGEHETLGARVDHYLAAGSIDALYELILARYEGDYERDRPNLVGDAFSLLWAARRGLSETELLDLMGTGGEPLPRAHWSPLYLAADSSLTSRSGLLGFFHGYLRAAVEHRYLPDERARTAIHLRLADYFASRELTIRKTEELPWQLARGRAWQRLAELLSDMAFLPAAWTVDQYEVEAYWAQVEANSEFRLIEAYRSVLEAPALCPSTCLRILGRLMRDAGHPDQALAVRLFLVENDRRTGNRAELQSSLGGLAVLLHIRGDTGAAMQLLREQEAICREIADLEGLQASLGNQALILRSRGDLDGALALHKEQERICRGIANRHGLHASLGNQALILKARGDFGGALELHGEKERICREIGDRDGLQRSLGNQGLVLKSQGDLDGAMALFKEQELIGRELGSLDAQQTSFGNQGLILRTRGDRRGAMALFKEQERICRELDIREGLANSLGSQALILKGWGDLDGAMALLKEEERICREVGNIDGLQISMANQANILYARRDLDGAMAMYEQNERLCRELGNKNELQICLGNQAAVLTLRGDVRGAMELLKQQEAICREIGVKSGLHVSLGNQANLLFALGDLDGSLALREQEEKICREIGDMSALGRSLGNRGLVLKARGNLDGAMALFLEQDRIARQLGDKNGLQASLGNQASVLQARDNVDGALTLLAEQLRLAREIGNPEAIARCLANQALLLGSSRGRPGEALGLALEAYGLARQRGLTVLAQQIRSIVERQGGECLAESALPGIDPTRRTMRTRRPGQVVRTTSTREGGPVMFGSSKCQSTEINAGRFYSDFTYKCPKCRESLTIPTESQLMTVAADFMVDVSPKCMADILLDLREGRVVVEAYSDPDEFRRRTASLTK